LSVTGAKDSTISANVIDEDISFTRASRVCAISVLWNLMTRVVPFRSSDEHDDAVGQVESGANVSYLGFEERTVNQEQIRTQNASKTSGGATSRARQG
jgi:hypothetical protein